MEGSTFKSLLEYDDAFSTGTVKIRNKKDWRGSPVASPMPKSVLSSGREDQLLKE